MCRPLRGSIVSIAALSRSRIAGIAGRSFGSKLARLVSTHVRMKVIKLLSTTKRLSARPPPRCRAVQLSRVTSGRQADEVNSMRGKDRRA